MPKVRNNFAWEIVLIACNLRLAIIILTTYYDTIIMFWFYIDINFFVN